MELVDGAPLTIPVGGLAESDVFDYALQIADAIAHAHERNVVHRGLQPDCIVLMPGGRVQVIDFRRGADSLAYLSPEQLRGEPATSASDVWSIGVVLFEMAVGRRPFAGHSDTDLIAAILERPPAALPIAVPAVLRGMISRCLAKDPKHRYQHAGELRDALVALRRGHVTLPSTLAGPPSRTGRLGMIAGLTAAALVLVVAIVLLIG
jgi:serine/threonine-protein kinase